MRVQCVIAFIAILSISTTDGCYSARSFDDEVRTTAIGIAAANNRLYLAGGSRLSQLSSAVNVFDPRSDTWESFQLPIPRKAIVVTPLGNYIYFSGGIDESEQPYRSVDIYNFRTDDIESRALNNSHAVIGSIVARSQIYLYAAQDEIIVLNPTAASTTILTHPARFLYAATNGSAIFFLTETNQIPNIEVLNLDSNAWSSIEFTPAFAPIDNIFHINNALVLVGRQQVQVIALQSETRRVFNHSSSSATRPVTLGIGNELYVLSDESVTVVHVQRGTTVTHQRLPRPYALDTATRPALLHDALYFFGTNHTHSRLVRFDMTQLFLQVPIESFRGLPTFAESGMLFWVSPWIGTIITYNLRLQMLSEYHMPHLRYTRASVGVKVNARFVVVAGHESELPNKPSNEYDAFDFDERVWGTGQMRFSFAATHATATGDYALFTSHLPEAALFHEPTSWWTRLPLNEVAHFATVIGTTVVVVHSRLELFDARSFTWHDLSIDRPASERQYSRYFASDSSVFICDRVMTGTQVTIFHVPSQTITKYHIDQHIDRLDEANRRALIVFTPVTGASPQRFPTFNVDTNEWRVIELPLNPTNPSDTSVALWAPHQDVILFVRSQHVDLFRAADWSVSSSVLTIGEPSQVLAVGSKLVVVHRTSEAQHILIYEESTSEEMTISATEPNRLHISATDNYIYTTSLGRLFQVVPIPAIMSRLSDQSVFVGGSTGFIARASGSNINFRWYHNDVPLDSSRAILIVENATEASAGEYLLEVTDDCNHRMTQRAHLTVNPAPVFDTPLRYIVALCDETTTVTVEVSGARVSFNWTLDGVAQHSTDSHVTIDGNALDCNAQHELCVTATNPSGTSRSCALMSITTIESVFDGPVPVTQPDNWFTGSSADLRVRILIGQCSSHEWFMNDVQLARFDAPESTINIGNLTRSIENARIVVRAVCGNSVLTSPAFSFSQVSPFTVAELALVIVASSVVFIAVVVIIVVVAKKRGRKGAGKFELNTFSKLDDKNRALLNDD